MKKLYLLAMTPALLLSACNNVSSEDEAILSATESEQFIQEEQTSDLPSDIEESTSETLSESNDSSWSYIIDNFPLTTYDEIKAGNYSEQYAIIPAIVDSAKYSEALNWVDCDVWYARGNSYVCDNITFQCDQLPAYDPQTLKPGDNIDICFYINADNSFGFDIKGYNTNGSTTSLEEIYAQFKQACSPINWEEIMRNPEAFRDNTYSFTGNVFQIISEKDGYIELLLSIGNDRYIHTSYTYKDNESHILENDMLTVYGTYYKLYKYISMLGTEQTIPSIVAEFIDIN